MSPTLIRTVSVFVPVGLTLALLAVRRPGTRAMAGMLLATVWNLPALLAVHLVSRTLGWWSFDAEGGMLAGLPVDLWLGWALLWGAVAHLTAALVRRIWPVVVAALWLDLLLMPSLAPVLRLAGDGSWLAGEAAALGLCLLPGLLLGRWTELDRHLDLRVVLQVLLVAAVSLWLLPTVVFAAVGGDWGPLLRRPGWQTGLALQLLAVPAAVALRAVEEFTRRGRGTPIPYDPPRRLVTTGPYAYLANPMQVGMMMLLAGWGALLGSWWLVAAAPMAVAYGAGLATWHEAEQLRTRFGGAWLAYRRAVRPWWPRWRPYVPDGGEARLYVAATCEPCSELGAWFAARDPIGLRMLPAEEVSTRSRSLRRLAYVGADGRTEVGTRALARGLEHLHLGWALLGWALSLPGVAALVQLVADAAGAGPRDLRPDRDSGRSRRQPRAGGPACRGRPRARRLQLGRAWSRLLPHPRDRPAEP